MNTKPTNPCTRCGKERIDSKSWKEKVNTFFGSSYITHTETVYPDKACQKIVEEKLTAQRAKTEALVSDREKRIRERLKAKTANRLVN